MSNVPPPNELIPVPVGTVIDPRIAPYVTAQPLVDEAQSTPNERFKLPPRVAAPPSTVRRVAAQAGLVAAPQPRLDRQYQSHLTTLQNKYTELAPLMASTPPAIRNAMIDYDARRVARGTAPLTREQTVLAIQTAMTGEQATPEPHRSPWNVIGNIASDLGDIVTSLPRLPGAIAHEITELPQIGTRIAQARAEGANPLSAVLQAPGFRMIPGAYTVGNALEGDFGELAEHPLITALDILPAAHGLASGTEVARLAQEARIAEAARFGRPAEAVRPRPIAAVLMNRVGEGGELVRRPIGQLADIVREQTTIGQAFESAFGRRARWSARMAGKHDQRIKALKLGVAKPATADEAFLTRLSDIFDRWSDTYPSLRHDATAPADAEWRAELFRQVQRDPTQFEPAFVNELRDLIYDEARYTSANEWTGWFDNELYPIDQARSLQKLWERARQGDRIADLRGEYLYPSGVRDVDWFRRMAAGIDDIADGPVKIEAARGLEAVLDAYGINPDVLRGPRARAITAEGYTAWRARLDTLLNDPNVQLTPRPAVADIVKTLRGARNDRQATLLEKAVLDGDLGEVSRRLDNLANRTAGVDPQFAEAARSAARRTAFEAKVGSRYTPKRIVRRWEIFENAHRQAAPARFHGLLSDELARRAPGALEKEAVQVLARPLTADEAAQLVRAVEQRTWSKIPGLTTDQVESAMRALERDVLATWQKLRDAGHDPLFVHVVSPERARSAIHTRIGPMKTAITQARARVLDLTPSVNDLQVAMTHQAAELVARSHSEQFIDELVAAAGRSAEDLRAQFLPEAEARASDSAILGTEGFLDQIIKKAYTRFNPDGEGFTWGSGAWAQKYRDNAVYLPKAIADNLKRYTGDTPRNFFTAISDPVTNLFRYQVIGLNAALIVNNFFGNVVTMTAESGLRPWKYWNVAREWLRDPSKIPNEELKALLLADQPFMEHLGLERWLATRSGLKIQTGLNAGQAFMDSAAWDAVKRGKRAIDGVVEKSLDLQRWSDNVFRVMQYMDELDRGVAKGLARETAENAAVELVLQTFVDYSSFTPIERSAIRTIIPFYSFMSHAARLVGRYPLNHPVRAVLMAHLAEAEKERLGALPGSFLSMVPIPLPGFGMDPETGAQTFLDLHRMFNPFDDTADLLSVTGFISAMNPTIQVALQQIGVVRGDSELYPTLRYDPETGRMRAVHPSLFESILGTVLPRFGPLASIAGIDPTMNELRARDPAAANRRLWSQFGIPRPWREFNIPQEIFRGEVNREHAANDVLNEAMRTGNWTEALRYPSLRAYFEQLRQLTPDQIAAMTPATPDDIAAQLATITGG